MAQLVERHLPGLRAFVRLQLGAKLRALESESDLVQSVCLELLKDLQTFEYEGEASFRQWLYTAALNKIRKKQRYWSAGKRDANRVQSLEDESLFLNSYAALCSPSHNAIAREQVDLLEKAFEGLPDHHREVLVLAKVVGLSQQEMADKMGKSVPSVRNLLNRALVMLAGELALLRK